MKILIPLLVVAAALKAVQVRARVREDSLPALDNLETPQLWTAVHIFVLFLQVLTMIPIKGLFLLVLFFSDAMALHFFFLVKDDGKCNGS